MTCTEVRGVHVVSHTRKVIPTKRAGQQFFSLANNINCTYRVPPPKMEKTKPGIKKKTELRVLKRKGATHSLTILTRKNIFFTKG